MTLLEETSLETPYFLNIIILRYVKTKKLVIAYENRTIQLSPGDLTNKRIKRNPIDRKIIFDIAIFFIFSIPWKYQEGEIPWKIEPTTAIIR